MGVNSITVTYRVNNGPPVQQLLNSTLGPNLSWNFTFNVNANLSACTTHTMKVWVTCTGDLNQSNDTLVWTVQNDCPVIPGTITGTSTVCSGSNSGTLNLTGWSNGTINNWEYSTNGGASWTGTGQNTTSYTYSNLSVPTIYRVVFEGGLCADATSQFTAIAVQSPPLPGTINGSDSVCAENASGTLTLTGTASPVNGWQYSTNGGVSWTPVTNTTTTYSYSSLSQTTLYRAQINGGACPSVWSDTAEIFVRPASVAGVLSSNQSLCQGESFLVSLAGYAGTIQSWESSVNGVTWTSISNTSATYLAAPATSRYYRVIVKKGNCLADTSNTVLLSVFSISPGTLSGPDSLCADNASGSFTLNGASHPVTSWQASTDEGQNWINISNTTGTLIFSDLTQTVWYRVFLTDGVCSVYSDTAILFVQASSNAGVISGQDTLCAGDALMLNLNGYTGTTFSWQASDNGTSWTSAGTSIPSYNQPNILTGRSFRVIVDNGICPQDTSAVIKIVVNPLPSVNAGTDTSIIEGDSVILNGTGGFAGVWVPGGSLSDSLLSNPIATPLETTVYSYVVISDDGCINSDQVEVEVIPYQDSTLFDIKNVISANNDGYNDDWIIEGVESFPQTFVVVYNTYGKEMYSSADYMNDWKGTYKGGRLPNGTYYYVVKQGGTGEEYKGTLTILGND